MVFTLGAYHCRFVRSEILYNSRVLTDAPRQRFEGVKTRGGRRRDGFEPVQCDGYRYERQRDDGTNNCSERPDESGVDDRYRVINLGYRELTRHAILSLSGEISLVRDILFFA